MGSPALAAEGVGVSRENYNLKIGERVLSWSHCQQVEEEHLSVSINRASPFCVSSPRQVVARWFPRNQA